MKKTIIIFILAILSGTGTMPEAVAQTVKNIIPGVSVGNFDMGHDGDYLTVRMQMDLGVLDVGSNRAVLLVPRLVNGADTLDLPAIGIYGRRRYYYYVRNGISAISGASEKSFRASEKPEKLEYDASVIYRDWMDGATLTLNRSDWGCCRKITARYDGELARHLEPFLPEPIFVQPKAQIMKTRSLSGSAYIDFPVNQTVIYPDYRRNTAELGRIQATIDSVRNDRDVIITSVWLKGYASPESPYSHNTKLAVGRTDALKRHIGQLYHFADSIILTDYEPEDWAGLRRYVEQSNLEHRAEILSLIDSDMDPDAKERKIKHTYPGDYRFMLQNFYPSLRHTDYRIDYRIRTFTDVGEIKRLMAEEPQKLSLNELYLVATAYKPGTENFTEVFETAARLFPNDETANLNAAGAAIQSGNHEAARRYLAKAGQSAEAAYMRGVLAIREKDYSTGAAWMEKARGMGLDKATAILKKLTEKGYMK